MFRKSRDFVTEVKPNNTSPRKSITRHLFSHRLGGPNDSETSFNSDTTISAESTEPNAGASAEQSLAYSEEDLYMSGALPNDDLCKHHPYRPHCMTRSCVPKRRQSIVAALRSLSWNK